MKKILVTGACGQIGSELVAELGKRFGKKNVVSTDIQRAPSLVKEHSYFRYLNVLDLHMIAKTVVEEQIDTVFHMAAILSASGEKNIQLAYDVNLNGLMNILNVSRLKGVKKVIVPSTIAVFGPDAPKENTPNETPLNPTTIYGVTKVAGEKFIQYYHDKFGLDIRSLRYPGIISSETLPGGGTTDYAVDMYLKSVKNEPYNCYIKPETPLPFMYMPDAISAIVNLAIADPQKLKRRVYNVHAMRLSPNDILSAIHQHVPEFRCQFEPDFRQNIAESWPASIDDRFAREEWGWQPEFDLAGMTRDMLNKLLRKNQNG